MAYHRYDPPPDLAPYIDSISVQEDNRPAPPGGWNWTRVLPTGRIDLILNLAEPFIQRENRTLVTVPLNSLTGQWTASTDVQATGRTSLLIVSFQPWGAASFFSLPLNEIADRSIDLEDLWSRARVAELRERVGSVSDPEARVAGVNQLLREALLREADPLAAWAVQEINHRFGALEIEDLASEAGVSRRTLLRRFKHATGLGPKLFGNIVRCQKALFLLRAGRTWEDAAGACQYYDQSHLIRELKHFTGHTPGSLQLARLSSPLQSFFNSRRNLSHFYNTVYL